MSESLEEITEKFLNIDVLDEKQDISRFVAYLLDTVELLASKVSFLEARDADRRDKTSNSESRPSEYRAGHADIFVGKVLHRVICKKTSHQHDDSYFEDEPTYGTDRHFRGETKLIGNKIVHSLDNYIGLHPNICFLVINEHNCTSYERFNPVSGEVQAHPPGPLPEKLRIVSPLLQSALLQIAEYYPAPRGQNLDYLRSQGMLAPYPFLFHHRQVLIQLSLDEMYKDVLRPLLEFLDINYNREYEEASSLFEKGFVTACHISKLFKPNQMVISPAKSGSLEAYILSWCHPLEKDTFFLPGWSWLYDGNELTRQYSRQRIEGVPDEPMRITDLKIYPADFSRDEDIKNLEERGRKFWSMKNQTYLSYTGWDKAREYHYVRAAPLSFPFGTFKLKIFPEFLVD
jgi:hypothetical protein